MQRRYVIPRQPRQSPSYRSLGSLGDYDETGEAIEPGTCGCTSSSGPGLAGAGAGVADSIAAYPFLWVAGALLLGHLMGSKKKGGF